MNQKIINIEGMHCRSCEMLVEDELTSIKGVKSVRVNQKRGIAVVHYKGILKDSDIEQAIANAGYSVCSLPARSSKTLPWFSRDERVYQSVVASMTILILGFLLLRATSIDKLFSFGSNNFGSLPVVFLVGLTAGVSTCMALVGGLVLGASARFSEKNPNATSREKFAPHLYFNLGRIISFFSFGALVGLLGSFLQMSTSVSGFLIIVAGLFMLFLGLQLTELFPRLTAYSFSLPKGISRALGIKDAKEREYSHKNSMLLGALTFFLPCGFTQAIQLYAISSGSPVKASLALGVFALGTTPGLLGIGGLTSVLKGTRGQMFFRLTGLVVVALAFFNISNGLTLTGLNSVLGASSQTQDTQTNSVISESIQIVKMDQKANGYFPNKFTVKKGVPVKWIVTSNGQGGCSSVLTSQKLNIQKVLASGENIFEFTPTEAGQIRFSCAMGMYSGAFTVIN